MPIKDYDSEKAEEKLWEAIELAFDAKWDLKKFVREACSQWKDFAHDEAARQTIEADKVIKEFQ
jgi:hypothetical protein